MHVRLAAQAERRGGFGTFGWAMWAAGMTRTLAPPPGLNELGVQVEEPTSCFQYKKTDSEAAGPTRDNWSHPILSPGGPGYDRCV